MASYKVPRKQLLDMGGGDLAKGVDAYKYGKGEGSLGGKYDPFSDQLEITDEEVAQAKPEAPKATPVASAPKQAPKIDLTKVPMDIKYFSSSTPMAQPIRSQNISNPQDAEDYAKASSNFLKTPVSQFFSKR